VRRRTLVVCLGLALATVGPEAAAQQLRVPRDLTYEGGGGPGPVVFSHESHVAYSEKCTACHIALFRILQPTHQVTHADMDAGRACGACHNSKTAFPSSDPAGCARCHGEEKQ
jgi:c(7)-type cytochrome triheme protein